MSGEVRRENFVDEASWLEFQRNQAELAKHKRQRELAEQHAKAGRNYDITKKLARKRRGLEALALWEQRNPVRAAQARRRKEQRRWQRITTDPNLHADHLRRRRERKEYLSLAAKLWKTAHYEEKNARRRAQHAANPWRERMNRARRVIEHPERFKQYEANKRLKRQMDPEREAKYRERERMRSQRRRSDPATREKLNTQARARAARKRAEKLAQQQQQAS